MLNAKKKIERKEIEQDQFFKEIDVVVRFFKANQQRIIILALIVILLGFVGWYYLNSQNKKTEKAGGQFGIAQFYLSGQQYDRASEKLNEVIDLYPNTKYGKMTLYYLGYINYNQKQMDKAIEYFNDYLSSGYDDDILNGASYNVLAKIYEDREDFGEAGINYENAYNTVSLDFKKLEYVFQAVECFIKSENFDKSNKLLAEVENQFELDDSQKDKVKALKMVVEIKK